MDRFFALMLALLPCQLLAQAPYLTSVSPVRNAVAAPRNSNVSLTFSQPMSAAAASSSAIKVFSQQLGGLLTRVGGGGNFSGGGTNTITFDPAQDFSPGEVVDVSVSTVATSQNGTALAMGKTYQFRVATGTGPASFSDGVDLPMDDVYFIAPVDIDGDNDVDLIASCFNPDSVRLFFNDGAGRFPRTTQIKIGVSSVSFRIAIGDIDGDGDIDLVVPSFALYSARLLLNDGTGSFSNGPVINCGAFPCHLNLADLDSDGDLDLLIGSYVTGMANTTIMFNNGRGIFASGGVYPWTLSSLISISDLDNDHDLDVLTMSYSQSNVNDTAVAHFNNGAGVFIDTTAILIPWAATGVTTGDMDGDGDNDLIAAVALLNSPSNKIMVRFNDGTGHFGGGADYPTNTAVSAIPADIDGDGDLDLLATDNTGFEQVLLNDGRGHLVNGATVAVTPYSWFAFPADLDGDRDLDFVVASQWHDMISIRFNDVPAGLTNEESPAFTLAPNPTRTTAHLTGATPGSRCTLFDGLGRIVLTTVADGTGAATFDVQKLPAGLYLVRPEGNAGARRLLVE